MYAGKSGQSEKDRDAPVDVKPGRKYKLSIKQFHAAYAKLKGT